MRQKLETQPGHGCLSFWRVNYVQIGFGGVALSHLLIHLAPSLGQTVRVGMGLQIATWNRVRKDSAAIAFTPAEDECMCRLTCNHWWVRWWCVLLFVDVVLRCAVA